VKNLDDDDDEGEDKKKITPPETAKETEMKIINGKEGKTVVEQRDESPIQSLIDFEPRGESPNHSLFEPQDKSPNQSLIEEPSPVDNKNVEIKVHTTEQDINKTEQDDLFENEKNQKNDKAFIDKKNH